MDFERLSSVRELLKRSLADSYNEIKGPVGLPYVSQPNLPADEVANLWKVCMDADKSRASAWPNPTVRIFVLVALFRRFERLRLQNYGNLRRALENTRTLSGRPLSILGTKCEMASRASEALFLEGRREPGSEMCLAMLEVAHDLLNMVLSECRQKEDPKYAKRYYGIRGVCALMLAVQRRHPSAEAAYGLFSAAAEDLQTAFDLGNRGPSSASYLLDALMHVFEIDQSDETLVRIDEVIALLDDNEKNDRGVRFQIGRQRFSLSFRNPDQADLQLPLAIQELDACLRLPTALSVDDAMARLVRGQVYVRLAIQHRGSEKEIEYLDLAIEDLKFAVETAPHKFAKQPSLPSALQTRADIFARARMYSEARDDLNYATRDEFKDTDPESFAQAEIKLTLIDLREALDQDNLIVLREILPGILEHPYCGRVGSVYVALAVKRLFRTQTEPLDPALLMKTIEVLKSVNVEPDQDVASRRMHLSLLGNLQYLMADRWDATVLEDAVHTYLEALSISSEPAGVELLSLYGNSCLALAKQILRYDDNSERAVELLEEASEALSTAASIAENDGEIVSESFKRVVTLSKAGEAQLRFCSLTGSAEYAKQAITSFENARALGNTTHEILGLTGDAYYRLFRIVRDPKFLQQASHYKRLARESGGTSRENLSLSSRLAMTLWEDSRDPQHLSEAITLVAEAHDVDSAWPWPPFQLLEMVDHVGPAFSERIDAVRTLNPGLKLLTLFGEDSQQSLVKLGCDLVVKNEEFARKDLGGRQPVYVLEDSHRLLSASYVFKHTDEKNARRDWEVISSFSSFLQQRGLRGFRLPEPLAIIPQPPDSAVYVMRRARGHHLGRSVIRAKRESTAPPLNDFERAINFLSAYHAWGLIGRIPGSIPLTKFIEINLRESSGLLPGIIPQTTIDLALQVGSCPQVLKKDAHPENWLIDDYGNICMIDFESSRKLPVIFEVVQLLDDYPLLDATEEGFVKRMEFCKTYMDRLEELSHAKLQLSRDAVPVVYAMFLILRCGFGLMRLQRHANLITSSSALRARSEREMHYQASLSWLASESGEAGIREFATVVLHKCKKLNA